MVALRGQDVEAFLRQPKSSQPYVLVFGPDEGLVRERIDRLLAALGVDTSDPFCFTRLSGETLRAEPDRLVEEASTLPLFGATKTIVVDMDARTAPSAFTRCLSLPNPQAWVLVLGRDLKRDHAVRQAFERAPNAIALPCYPDTPRDIKALIANDVRAQGKNIDPDALEMLSTLLGADRAITRSEIDKLLLYCQDQANITAVDVENIIAEAQSTGVEQLIDLTCAGETRAIVEFFSSSQMAKLSLTALHIGLIRWLLGLHQMRLKIEAGAPATRIVEETRPVIHFSRKTSVTRALERWTSGELARAIELAQTVSLEARRNGQLATALTERCLIQIAQMARQRR